MPGTLDDLRAAVTRRLETLPALAGVPVIPEDRQDLAYEIDRALGQAGGLVVTVGTGSAKAAAPGDPLPQSDAEIVVECAEIPSVNRAEGGRRLPAVSAANIAICALHHWPWERGKALVYDEIIYDRDDKKAAVIYTCVFKTRVAHRAALGE
jgi:hypothetical protein